MAAYCDNTIIGHNKESRLKMYVPSIVETRWASKATQNPSDYK
jgi:hypothetical protein